MKRRSARGGAVALAAAMALATLSMPAQADDDSENESQGLEVELRPAIATPSGVVTIAAEYELEEDSEDDEPAEEAPEHESVTEDPDPSGGGASAEPSTEPEPLSGPSPDPSARPTVDVEMVVDFGDGSLPEPMRTAGNGREDIKAFANHAYVEAGSYTVTVTATPSGRSPVSVPVIVQVGGGSARLGGDDRFDTANRLSQEDFPTDGDAGAVLLARSDGFADALAAASVAVLEDAPVLLTATAELPAGVLEEITRALGETGVVYLLGGESAIAPSVAEAVAAAGYDVVRLSGEDRVETAIGLAQFLVDSGVDVDEVVLANSTDFPDALAGAAYAAGNEAPVLLTSSHSLDPRVRELLVQLGDVEVHVVGGESAVSDAVLLELAELGIDVERISGEDRYDTAVTIAEALFPAPSTVTLATGGNFPDALAGAAAAGRRDAPVLLVGQTLPESVRDYLKKRAGQIDAVYVLGGEGAVSPMVMEEARALLGL